MQELVLYRSRCDNRLNEVRARVSADRNEVVALAKKYEEKYKQKEDVTSKLTIEEATFRDIQERKMELYQAIVKMEGGIAVDVLKEQLEQIQSVLEELTKTVNECCKHYGLRSKATSLVELPFGWQPGIQEGSADWGEDWDKFKDEGLIFVKELTLDVQNVVAPPKTSTLVREETSSISGDNGASPSNAKLKSENVRSPGEPCPEKESSHHLGENGMSRSPSDSPAGKSATESNELHNSPVRKSAGADGSLHSKEIQSDMVGAESVLSSDKSVGESYSGYSILIMIQNQCGA